MFVEYYWKVGDFFFDTNRYYLKILSIVLKICVELKTYLRHNVVNYI